MKIFQKPTHLRAAALMIMAIIIHGRALAMTPLDRSGETSWHISAATATYDTQRKLYVARGNVVITGGGTRLEADYAEFSNITRDALATGHVLLISGEDTVTCNSIKMNLATETGTIYQGTIFIRKNNFYISGDRIKKTGAETYTADRAAITSCPGDKPDWKITGRDIKVTIGGYGYAAHSTLWARDLPVAYSPFLTFPVRTRRQSGLLTPRITTSDRRGFEYEQPLFLALSPSTDATLYTHYMSKRGVKVGGEYRYINDASSRGVIELEMLSDDKTDDGTAATDQWAYSSTPVRSDSSRYWLRSKHDQKLGWGTTARLDLDVVSDADYLREFQDGLTGFDASDAMFTKIFARGLDDYDDTTRTNSLNLSKAWDRYSLSLDLNWYDDVEARQDNLDDTTLQDLPVIRFNALDEKAGDLPCYLGLDSEYRYFFRKDTTDTLIRGQRMDIHPDLTLPLHFDNGITLTAGAGIRQTLWYLDEDGSGWGSGDNFFHRTVPDFTTNLSTRISRVFDTKGGFFGEKIKHEITPMITYAYIPDIDQDDLPRFDSLDCIQEKNLISWRLTQRLTSRRDPPLSLKKRKGESESNPVYREFFWLSLSQDFDIERSREDHPRPFTDITASLEFYPHDSISLEGETSWSPYDNRFPTKECALKLTSARGDYLRTEYRREESVDESIIATINAVVTPKISVRLYREEDLMADTSVESRAGVNFHNKCWSLDIEYIDEQDDRSVAFLVNLYGIGEIGTK